MAQSGSQQPASSTSFSDLDADVLLMIYEAAAVSDTNRTHKISMPGNFNADGSISVSPFNLAAALPPSWAEHRRFASRAAFRETMLVFEKFDFSTLGDGTEHRLQWYEDNYSQITQNNPTIAHVKSLYFPNIEYLLFLLADVLCYTTTRSAGDLNIADASWRGVFTNVEVVAIRIESSGHWPSYWWDRTLSSLLVQAFWSFKPEHGLVYRDIAGERGLGRLVSVRQEVMQELYTRFPKLKAIHYICEHFVWVRILRHETEPRPWTCWYRSPMTDTSFAGYEHIMDGAVFDQHHAEPDEEDWKHRIDRNGLNTLWADSLQWTVWWTKNGM